MEVVHINRTALPPDEREAAGYIEQNLIMLQSIAGDFRHTVDLYMHIRELRRLGQLETWRKVAWTKIAGRNGAIEANGCAAVFDAVIKANAPTLWAKVDMAQRESATRLFSAEFPDVASVRNSTAHPGELTKTAVEIEKHRAVAPATDLILSIGAVFIADGMQANDQRLIFSATFKKRLVSYELSYAKADALDQAVTQFVRAFHPLGKY